MIEAEIPACEPQRLAALQQLNLLDTPIEERFERITRLLCRFLNVPIAAVSLLDSGRQWFKSIQGLDAIETSRQAAFCAHAILGEEALIVPDARADVRFHDNPLVVGDPRIAFYAGQPLHAPDGSRVGTLCALDRHPRDLNPDDVQTLRDLAAIAETEFRIAALSEVQRHLTVELTAERRRARIDGLTRLWNRTSINEILSRELSRSARSAAPLAVVMADVDHFKRINDTYGHSIGDEVLRVVSRRFLQAIRPNDAIGRFGGEEFLFVLPDCSNVTAAAVAQRLRTRLAEADVPTAAGPIRVTASFGVASWDAAHRGDAEGLIRAADAALYQAKRMGRNRVAEADMTFPSCPLLSGAA